MTQFFQRFLFTFRWKCLFNLNSSYRKFWLRLAGMHIGKRTFLRKIYITWPQQVYVGENCNFEHNIYFKFDGIWKTGYAINIGHNVFIGSNCEFNISKSIIIGNNTLIASGCRFIDHDHGTKLGELIGKQPPVELSINVGSDVWLGCNVVVLKGVTIGDGAVVAAGAVVTKNIPCREIWGGVPAKKISIR